MSRNSSQVKRIDTDHMGPGWDYLALRARVDGQIAEASALLQAVVDRLCDRIADNQHEAYDLIDDIVNRIYRKISSSKSTATKLITRVTDRLDARIISDINDAAALMLGSAEKAGGLSSGAISGGVDSIYPPADTPQVNGGTKPPPLGDDTLPGDGAATPCDRYCMVNGVAVALRFVAGLNYPYLHHVSSAVTCTLCATWFNALTGEIASHCAGVDPGPPWIPAGIIGKFEPPYTDEACQSYELALRNGRNLANQWTFRRCDDGTCFAYNGFWNPWGQGGGNDTVVSIQARIAQQQCEPTDNPCNGNGDGDDTLPGDETIPGSCKPDECCPINPDTEESKPTEKCCFPCPAVSEKDIRNARILPWGRKQGTSAWSISDCGSRELFEAMAENDPVSDLIDLIAGPDSIKELGTKEVHSGNAARELFCSVPAFGRKEELGECSLR